MAAEDTDPLLSTLLQGVHASPSVTKQSQGSKFIPQVTPNKKMPPFNQDSIHIQITFNDDLDSQWSLSQHTCHLSPEDQLKAKIIIIPTIAMVLILLTQETYFIHRDTNKSELEKWKDKTLHMVGKIITITYDQKRIFWEVKDLVEHNNVHINKNIDESCFVTEDLDCTVRG